MSQVSIQLTPAALATIERVRRFPLEFFKAVARVHDSENEKTVGHIQLTRLSQRGPDTLGVVTNRLRSSIRPSKAVITGDAVQSAIGTNVEYAGAHEFGFRGAVSVKAHTRRGGAGDRFAVAGNPAASRFAAARLGAFSKKRQPKPVAIGVAQVKAHTRNVNIPERAPLRRGIEERLPRYAAAISAEVTRGWNGGAT